MRRTILLAAALATGCGQPQQPANQATEVVEMSPATEVTNAAPDIAPDANAAVPRRKLSLDDCLKMGGGNCAIGRRGTPERPCFGLMGFLADKRGREVHAAPDLKSRVLGRIHGETDNDYDRAASFDIVEGHDGWLRIDNAADDPDINGGVERDMYHSRGWIRGEDVQAAAQAGRAFSAPDFASPVAIELGPHGFDGAEWVAILGCDGSWVQGRWHFRKDVPDRGYPRSWRPEALVSRDPLVLEGWVTGICTIVETTCDGVTGDAPPE